MPAAWKALCAGLSFFALAACGGETATTSASDSGDTALPGGGAAKEAIEARQAALKNTGKAFKTISDTLKSGEPDIGAIQSSAATVSETAANIGSWFPEGTSAASGVKTAALDFIWEKPEEFDSAVARLQAASADLTAAAESGDAAAISAAFQATGGACKNCHDSFRADDD